MMRKIVLVSLLVAAFVAAQPSAFAADSDGRWNVTIMTDKGSCDRGFRYPVLVYQGHASYAGDADLEFDGSVAADGAATFNFVRGATTGHATGSLTAAGGTGKWTAKGCSGHWEATRSTS